MYSRVVELLHHTEYSSTYDNRSRLHCSSKLTWLTFSSTFRDVRRSHELCIFSLGKTRFTWVRRWFKKSPSLLPTVSFTRMNRTRTPHDSTGVPTLNSNFRANEVDGGVAEEYRDVFVHVWQHCWWGSTSFEGFSQWIVLGEIMLFFSRTILGMKLEHFLSNCWS